MKRTGDRWILGFVLSGIFLPLLALGCNSMKQTRYPSVYEADRTGTVPVIWPKQHGASCVDETSGR